MINADKETIDFYARHCAAGGIVMVNGYQHGNGESATGVFSSLERAHAWADRFPKDWAFVFAPFVVDTPEFGNIPREKMQ